MWVAGGPTESRSHRFGAVVAVRPSRRSRRDGPQRPAGRSREVQLGVRIAAPHRYVRRTTTGWNNVISKGADHEMESKSPDPIRSLQDHGWREHQPWPSDIARPIHEFTHTPRRSRSLADDSENLAASAAKRCNRG